MRPARQQVTDTPTNEPLPTNDVLWKLWEHLEDAVRTGEPGWKTAFGWDGPVLANIFHSDAVRREFLMGMHGYGLISSPKVVAAFDLSRFTRLVDLGGATGHLAVAACRRYTALRAVVYDLPEVVPPARELVGASGVADRVEVAAGDLFAHPLPPADLYALGRVLHDWSEEKIAVLLRKRTTLSRPAAGCWSPRSRWTTTGRATVGAGARPEHAAGDGGPRADPRGVRGAAEAGRVRGSGRPPDRRPGRRRRDGQALAPSRLEACPSACSTPSPAATRQVPSRRRGTPAAADARPVRPPRRGPAGRRQAAAGEGVRHPRRPHPENPTTRHARRGPTASRGELKCAPEVRPRG